eukprot:TRINITY_DN8820_c0_g3_i2.p1 TRINITY_DN8820_c0_g3~~TRINITY_DN8820_c0_g3_i2.p1  ORF type:complete len:592 (+),score=145.74 TRINITY_DN8820_c0_g3_i2:98-1873(+)
MPAAAAPTPTGGAKKPAARKRGGSANLGPVPRQNTGDERWAAPPPPAHPPKLTADSAGGKKRPGISPNAARRPSEGPPEGAGARRRERPAVDEVRRRGRLVVEREATGEEPKPDKEVKKDKRSGAPEKSAAEFLAQTAPDAQRKDNSRITDGVVGHILDNFGIPSRDLEVDMGRVLGEGGFGIVYKGDFQGTEVAVKMMLSADPAPDQLDEWKKEVIIMTRLRHPNILMLLGGVFEEGNMAIVTEFCEKGTLKKIVKEIARGQRPNVKWSTRLDWLLQVAKGMTFLHHKRVHHRDIKASNIFVTGNTMKIADFGLSKFRLDSSMPMAMATSLTEIVDGSPLKASNSSLVASGQLASSLGGGVRSQTLHEAFSIAQTPHAPPSVAAFLSTPRPGTAPPAAPTTPAVPAGAGGGAQKGAPPNTTFAFQQAMANVSVLSTGAEEKDADASGTFAFVAPELWRGTPFGDAADVYAFGVMIIEVLTARVPFDNVPQEDEDMWAKRIALGQARPRMPVCIGGDAVPASLRRIGQLCHAVHRRQRPTFKAVVEMLARELRHPYASLDSPTPHEPGDGEEDPVEEWDAAASGEEEAVEF